MVLLLCVVSTMPPTNKFVFESEEYRQTNVISFIRKYPYFSIMLLAVIFIFFHIILYEHIFCKLCSLLGNSSNLGTAMFIQAVVEIPVLFAFSFIMRKIKVENLMIVACA